ncbi:FAD-dependent oxidoreductase [Roseobacter sp. HKCCD9010]|uniref:NAD(P)/FAD-dependent oxidoreductase n=1 Tax=unclassified Roseobacter TaxID=196798 RepID=UPI0014915C91|nr:MULTISPECIES: FAD-binding oxidoreductase [unclassified Roseobacter]MBF9048676.1 FAD-dependent oxidoreductase [Rhodobacterales bacterium HKCCD4356]NNV10675.1 FAD-dependent oxidoreductase [Roseobacter sp. HKCCD7357]NNV14860.1 FAD-dependent oxidoreductase [Roseobacter sp. HKCCD8768]NNV24319.1 FAD-dependent oxidoreductase [Roseobacter sp. HKCCD8192]NNV28576.1 FAD-dependent oxidoreductase [Roseobacter sp. HKCCD9061]
MANGQVSASPTKSSYDVVIIGGAIMGSSTAWFLSDNPDFNGSVLVVERDPTYETASTTHTNSCMRQQFSTELNVRVSQFAAEFVKNLRSYMGGDDRVPALSIRSFGYMYLADTDAFANVLRANQKVQLAAGAATQLMTPEEIAAAYPFYNTDDIVLGSINLVDEGYWDGATVFDWWRRQARERGVEYVTNEVVAMTKNASGTRVDSVTLKSGDVISCGQVVNASGPRAARTARMAGIDVPVEPRKRYSWVFKAETPLDRDLPLTIDPSGVHVRENGGGTYQCGGHSDADPAVAHDDFSMDHGIWTDHVWPILATRIPQFEAIKVQNEWAGHYAMNTFDHNAITGSHPEIENFVFLNGFSGHGLQQSPAMGRGTAEWLTYGEYRSLDLSPFSFDRIGQNAPIVEKAVI